MPASELRVRGVLSPRARWMRVKGLLEVQVSLECSLHARAGCGPGAGVGWPCSQLSPRARGMRGSVAPLLPSGDVSTRARDAGLALA